MPEYARAHLAEKYKVHYWPDPDEHQKLLRDPVLKTIRAVQTNGSYGLKRPFIEAMPALEIICAVGAGYEGIDIEAAKERGIVVTNGAGANAETVAEQAWALLLGVVRDIPGCDRGVRQGRWTEVRRLMPQVSGKKLGIFGLGHVGMAMAKRGAAGFSMEVGYHNRRPRSDVSYRYFDSLLGLADWADVLMIGAPGGAQTRHAVGREILGALGPKGFLVNISRGSLVDSAALAEALSAGGIAGAALDVIEGEPEVPEAFLTLDNLVMSPHVGGFSAEAIESTIHKVRDNLDAHFAGRPVLSPVLA